MGLLDPCPAREGDGATEFELDAVARLALPAIRILEEDAAPAIRKPLPLAAGSDEGGGIVCRADRRGYVEVIGVSLFWQLTAWSLGCW